LRLLDAIESRGGALRAIERGEIQREIEESAYRFQRSLETGDTVIVGVNQFVEENEIPRTDLLRVDPGLERDQVERLRALRARRDAPSWAAALDALARAARTETNLMPLIIDAVIAWATVGEIATCLRGVFGEHRDALT
ncbi:MAG: methylmalonyl-CoA mutase, partial [Vicinamibacteria bacterium]|nr:methylmalonyl-CoA mutase [Vicinamibacteria bacterium]